MTTPGCPVKVLWDPAFEAYDFGPGHPFTEKSRHLAVRLLEESGYFGPSPPSGSELVKRVESAGRDDLLRFHREEYLGLVERAGRDRHAPSLDAGDTPAFFGCFAAASAVVGGTLTGLRYVEQDALTHAFNPAGGLHHAHPGRASGFCIFNDLAVAMRRFQQGTGTPRRVAYVDIDVHHGDGVMYGFYEDGTVLDIDFHQDGRTIFPGTGFPSETGHGDGAGLKVNLPLPPGAGDEAFVPLFEQVVPTLLRSYRPELIVLQCGTDAHVGDGLGELQYTSRSYGRAVELVHRMSHEVAGGRLLVTGGGGYTAENVARSLARAAVQLRTLPRVDAWTSPLPEGWRTEFERIFRRPAPRTWSEGPEPDPSPWTAERGEKLLETLGERLGVRWDRSELTGREPAPG